MGCPDHFPACGGKASSSPGAPRTGATQRSCRSLPARRWHGWAAGIGQALGVYGVHCTVLPPIAVTPAPGKKYCRFTEVGLEHDDTDGVTWFGTPDLAVRGRETVPTVDRAEIGAASLKQIDALCCVSSMQSAERADCHAPSPPILPFVRPSPKHPIPKSQQSHTARATLHVSTFTHPSLLFSPTYLSITTNSTPPTFQALLLIIDFPTAAQSNPIHHLAASSHDPVPSKPWPLTTQEI